MLLLSLVVSLCAESPAGPWHWPGSFPSDVVFVKGKKVAGTTVGGVMRRLGRRYGVRFFSPKVPQRSSAAWRSGDREKWILREFERFYGESNGSSFCGWAQEQTLSLRRTGLEETALAALAKGALRVTVIREPLAHAVSACTHFGPCAVKTEGNKVFANTSAAARVDWVQKSLGPAQMWRFITPWPSELTTLLKEEGHHNFSKATCAVAQDFYNVVLLADDIDASLVAMAFVLDVALEDVLYVAAKTTHTERRPPVQAQPENFQRFLKDLFYAGFDADTHQQASESQQRQFAPDTHLYLWARARLDATIASIGRRRFQRDLDRFKRMQQAMLSACHSPKRKKKKMITHSTSDSNDDELTKHEFSARLPPGITPKLAHECLYIDQGCGFRCIDAWVKQHHTPHIFAGGAAAGRRQQQHHRPPKQHQRPPAAAALSSS